MKRQDITEELHHPGARDLLDSATLLRLGYNGSDGFTRVIPIGFHWTGTRSSSAPRRPRQGGGVVVASGGCADDRCRRHAHGGEGTLDSSTSALAACRGFSRGWRATPRLHTEPTSPHLSHDRHHWGMPLPKQRSANGLTEERQ